MNNVAFTYWQDEEFWLGYIDEYLDYMTQGHIPFVRKRGTLEV